MFEAQNSMAFIVDIGGQSNLEPHKPAIRYRGLEVGGLKIRRAGGMLVEILREDPPPYNSVHITELSLFVYDEY